MSSEALRAWRAVTCAVPARKLNVPALGVRCWVAGMRELPGLLRGLSLQREFLPDVDVRVLIDPLQGTGLLVVPQAAEWVMSDASDSSVAQRPTLSAKAMDGPGWHAAGAGQAPGRGRPGAQSEASRQSFMEAQGLRGQASHLANILQRHAASVAKSGVEAQSAAERGMSSPELRLPHRPAAECKVVYLPTRQAAAAVMPDALRAAGEPARWQTNMAATLSRWAQSGMAAAALRRGTYTVSAAVGRGLPEAIAGMLTTRPSSAVSRRRPNDVLEAARVAAKPTQGPAEFPTSKPMVGPPATARLALAVQAALASTAGRTGNAEAVAAPLVESLARIVEQLTTIEFKFSQRAAVAAPAAGRDEHSPAVQWLEDDDLAGRLQGILRRQARRRGIDLS